MLTAGFQVLLKTLARICDDKRPNYLPDLFCSFGDHRVCSCEILEPKGWIELGPHPADPPEYPKSLTHKRKPQP